MFMIPLYLYYPNGLGRRLPRFRARKQTGSPCSGDITKSLKGHVKYMYYCLPGKYYCVPSEILLRSNEIVILFRSLEISVSFPRNKLFIAFPLNKYFVPLEKVFHSPEILMGENSIVFRGNAIV